MFGKNFKYVLVLGFLATFTYTNPAVLNSISSGIAYNSQQAAVWDALFMHNNAPQISSTTRMIPPFASSTWASSTRPEGDSRDNQMRPDHPIVAQDVVTALFKAGIISSDKLDQARKIAASFEASKVGSSTPTRLRPIGSSTMPYPPMMNENGGGSGEGETGQ